MREDMLETQKKLAQAYYNEAANALDRLREAERLLQDATLVIEDEPAGRKVICDINAFLARGLR